MKPEQNEIDSGKETGESRNYDTLFGYGLARVTEMQMDESRESYDDIVSNLFNLRLDRYLGNIYPDRFNLTSNMRIQEVSEWYRSESLVLVLGAGASKSYGLPDWNTLLRKLLMQTLGSDEAIKVIPLGQLDTTELLSKIYTNIFELNPLISARYLDSYFTKKQPGSKIAFEKAVRKVLYEDLDMEKDESELLKEIRKYCIAPGKKPNLNSIITYNYDDILEQYLQQLDIDIPFTEIHTRGKMPDRYSLPIYHVHGYLPQEGRITHKNKVVLGEEEYHKQYTDVYGWSNLVQINKFKDYNCLFIGLSFSDPNLRRLLDISKNERGNDDRIHHYSIRKRYEPKKIKERINLLLQNDEQILNEKVATRARLDEMVIELIELKEKLEWNDALSFGVDLIWVDDYDEIPDVLKRIRQYEPTGI